ncbi:MAG: LysM peptidoglycan-binding domain-containing protein [Thermonemataceae bacterium]
MKQLFKYIFICLLTIQLPSLSLAQNAAPTEADTQPLEDTNTQKLLENYVPQVHESLIKERLACLEKDIKLPYHSVVRKHIQRYLVKDREQTRLFMMRKERYFPIFEEALAKHGLPDEIKYLSIVESALIPRIRSWAAAIGLWQFIPSTGRQYGLYQDGYIDERMDPYESTDAACRYLKYLHKMFGDWHLALAAYNCGPGNVQRAIRRSGNKTTFWEIYYYLPRETRNYVPMFIAINYVMNHTDEHFVPPPDKTLAYIPSDTIQVSQYVNLMAFSKETGIPFGTLQDLNPHLKKNIVPYYMKKYPLRIPAEEKEKIVANRKEILAAAKNQNVHPVSYAAYTPVTNVDGKQKVIHRVRYGEFLSLIAQRYGVSVLNLKNWNKLTSDVVYVNQRLVIWKEAPKTKVATTQKKVVSSPAYHVVQPGDTLWNISQRYKNLSVEKLRKLNPHLKGNLLVTGQKIRVG